MTYPLARGQRTLGELRAELAARLGTVTQGEAAQDQRALLDSFLQEAHEAVCAQLDDALLRKTAHRITSPGESRYDWHDPDTDAAIDALRVEAVGVQRGDVYIPLIHGISASQQAQSGRGCPTRYERFDGQCWLWPTPDARYRVSITYCPLPARFTQDADRPGVPDRLVFLYALASAKAQDRAPDAAVAGKAFEALLAQYKRRRHGARRYGTPTGRAAIPHVVRAEHGRFLCIRS
jgi:hypothetical protein